MGISIIICCFNSATRIEPTLKHLIQQKLDINIPWEVILVDNNSKDNTATLANSIWNNSNITIPLRIVSEPKAGLSFARKKGVYEAVHDIVIFCDDDNWLSSNYINDVFQTFEQNPKIGAIGGQGIPYIENQAPKWFKDYMDGYACGPQSNESGYVTHTRNYLYGAGLAVRKELLLKLYDLNKLKLTDRKGKSLTSGGDSEITIHIAKLGYELYYDSQISFYHYIPVNRLTFDYLKKLHYSFGKAHYHLYPLQLSITNPNIKKYPISILFKYMKNNTRNIVYFIFTKKEFSGTIKGAWAWGLLSEAIKSRFKLN